MAKNNLINIRFYRLLVLKEVGRSKDGHVLWLCQCDCGNKVKVQSNSLLDGQKSCGCLVSEMSRVNHTTHGQSNSPEYRAWRGMTNRCYNKSVKNYHNYGGRGIKVCRRWLYSFENFFLDMGKRPSPKHSLDRHPNINGNYSPNNCRWATQPEQMRGQTTNLWYEYEGVKMVVEDWRRIWGLSKSAIQGHINRGKTFKEVFIFYESKRIA